MYKFANMKSYRDLIVWQKSIDLVTLIYKLTDSLIKKINLSIK